RNGSVRDKYQAHRPGRTSRHRGSDSQRAHGARHHGSAAHAAGRVRIRLRHDGAGRTTLPRADTHFRIASNTKTTTAAVIVLLVQEGKLRFNDPISKYVSGVPNGDNITISELLKMRSGLFNYTSAPELAESLDHDPARVWTTDELLATAFNHPPVFAPGTRFDYCNTNYALLGLIAEKVEGAPLARIFQDR